MIRTFLLISVFYFCQIGLAFAHSGGLDSSGGHYDRKNGGYHYHNRTQTSPKTKYRPKTYKYSAPEVTVKSASKPIQRIESVRVVGYMDGDTIKVLKNNQQIKVRLYGIDCPENSQAYGKKAKQAIVQILKGRSVKIKIME